MPSRKIKISDEENQKPLFFDSLHIMQLPVNNLLPPLQILSAENISGKLLLKFRVPEQKALINIYILVNGKRVDMFYQLREGTYSFMLPEIKNKMVELFYVSGSMRSQTVFSFIKG